MKTEDLKEKELTPQRKAEKFDEIMEMLERARKENWNDWDIHRGLVRITAYE